MSTTSLVLTLIGDDRPGLVKLLSDTIRNHDGNWQESHMAQLAGKFAGILRVAVAADRAEPLTEALRALQGQGLTVVVESSATASAGDSQTLILELVGQDRPGIVRDIAETLAAAHISIDEMESWVSSASMSGEELFHAQARLQVPAEMATDELRTTLEALADEMMVDINLDLAED